VTRLLELLGAPVPGDDASWRRVLALADRTLCTPLLQGAPEVPSWFAQEIQKRIEKIGERRSKLVETYREAAGALDRAGIDFILIKGFTHEIDADVDPTLRAQGDIDLLCQPHEIDAAQNALRGGGFVFHPGSELSDNHGRPLLKPHAWQWREDYFDPTQPVPVEVHHSIWSERRDRIPTQGTGAFWGRRESMEVAGLRVPVYCDVDRLAIAALHVLRHVLRNNVRLGHAWELERMLRLRAEDRAFWERWRRLHPAPLRGLQALAFRFACQWFGEEMPRVPREDWNAQPAHVHAWFERSALSPIENLTRPNKDVLWLHMALLPRFADRWAVARRRMLPLRVPGSGELVGASYPAHIAKRARYHALALARAIWTGSTARSKASHTSD
jgi:hypothetical protein